MPILNMIYWATWWGGYTTLTCYIDESKSDPSQMVTYWSDVPFSVWSSDWDDFFGYYPCLLDTSWQETALLDTMDYSKDKDWNSVNITSGDNVMVCFPRLWIKMSKSGNIITMQLTNDPNNQNFTYLAHQRGTTDKDKFYYWAYKAYNDSNVLKSWSGKSPAVNISNNDSRSYAQANWTGYEMSAFFQRTFIQVLYIFKYANLNSQATIWKGYVSGGGVQTTWATNTSWMSYGNTSSWTWRMKLFWIEDLRWNAFEWVEWLYYNNYIGYIANHDFNLTQTNYTYTYNTGVYDGNNYMKAIFWNPSLWFLCDTWWANSSTYYCDLFDQDSYIGIPFCWWPYNFGDKAWIFCLFANDASGSYWDIWPRIMYL